MKDLIKVMKALSDPGRVKIVKMLEMRELCVCEITEALGLAQPTVSKHLKVLEEAGLVDFSKEGLWVNYRLAPRSENPHARAMLAEMKEWLNSDPELAALLSRLPQIRRETLCSR
ncbi:MAG: metalloregulator ArsR/SmtB family transcription factor [Proteobacteria bacterium]|nr:metalloregulator ArsR/SmtB family transcription factor [Pseudomonadota bacterium]